MYALSIVTFWNIVIAIRAYRFTHFKNTSNAAQQAGLLDYVTNRVTGSNYYKLPIKQTPKQTFTNVTLNTDDKVKLAAWHLPANNSKGTVLLFHGLGGNRELMLSEAYGLTELGYSVFTIDFRGHGNSDGNNTTLGWNEAIDVKAAYDYVKAKGEKNIIMYGASMGASSISACLHRYNTVLPNKVILDMPFDNFVNLTENFFKESKYPAQPTFTLFTFWASVFNQKWMFDVKPTEYVKDIKCPTLVQWGNLDQLVPQSSIDNIVANISATKTFVTYENLGHQSYINGNKTKWQSTVQNFLK